jgi:drug/metabolite transporter (DMT)-like permease
MPDWDEVSRYLLERIPLFYVFMSGVGFSFQSLIIKLLTEDGFHGSFFCVFIRGWCQLTIASGFIYYTHRQDVVNYKLAASGDQAIPVAVSNQKEVERIRLFGNNNFTRLILFGRATMGFGSIALSFLATELIPMGDATVLLMLSPMIASIAAALLLNESWKAPELVATLLSITGAVLVAKPAFIFGDSHSHFPTHGSEGGTAQAPHDNHQQDHNAAVGVICGVISSVFAGFAYICVRILGTTAKMPWPNVCFSQALAQIICSPPCLIVVGQHFSDILHVTPYQLLLLFLGGFIGSWSQVAMTVGMQREKSATASAMRMSDVVFGFIWQVLFTQDAVSGLSVLGAVLVTSSIMVVIVMKPTASTNQQTMPVGASGIELPAWDSSAHAMLNKAHFTIEDPDDMDGMEGNQSQFSEGCAIVDGDFEFDNHVQSNPLQSTWEFSKLSSQRMGYESVNMTSETNTQFLNTSDSGDDEIVARIGSMEVVSTSQDNLELRPSTIA